MDLGLAVPEIFRKMLLADEKARPRQRRATGEGERERTTSTLEPSGRCARRPKSKRWKSPRPLAAKSRRSASASPDRSTSIAIPSPASRNPATKRANEKTPGTGALSSLEPLAQADPIEERPVELDDMIFGASGMAVARPTWKPSRR